MLLRPLQDRLRECADTLLLGLRTDQRVGHELVDREPLVGQILKRAVLVEIACKHLANPARAHRSVIPQLDALVVPARDQLVQG